MRKSSIEEDAVVWCIRNGYKVYPVTEDNENYQVYVSKGTNSAKIANIYKKRDIDKALLKICIKIYKQHNESKD